MDAHISSHPRPSTNPLRSVVEGIQGLAPKMWCVLYVEGEEGGTLILSRMWTTGVSSLCLQKNLWVTCVTFLSQEASKNPATDVEMVQNTCIPFLAQMKLKHLPRPTCSKREGTTETNTSLLAPPCASSCLGAQKIEHKNIKMAATMCKRKSAFASTKFQNGQGGQGQGCKQRGGQGQCRGRCRGRCQG